MSILIDLQQSQKQQTNRGIPINFKQHLKTIIRNTYYSTQSIIEDIDHLIFILNASSQTLYLPTKWQVKLTSAFLRIQISFLNHHNFMVLRVKSERMKIQLSILIKKINKSILPDYKFLVQPNSGIVRFIFVMSWNDYKMTIKKIGDLNMVIKFIINEIRNYINEITYFCFLNQNQIIKCQTNKKQVLSSINKFRTLLRNTPAMRSLLDNFISIKENPNSNPIIAANVMRLYLNYIDAFNQSQLGVENLINIYDQRLIAQTQIVCNNQRGLYTQEKKQQKKIVYGLIQLMAVGQRTLLSKQGAHSSIYKQKFVYKAVETINMEVLQNLRKRDPLVKEVQSTSYLAYKVYKAQNQTSKNSFFNQLSVLQFLRGQSSPFICRYYLIVRNSIDESEAIYMMVYNQNLYKLIKQAKALSLLQKLTLSYRISKGLCFLSYNSISHRDFKPHNVVVDAKLNPRIIDFGSAVPHYDSNKFTVRDKRLLTTQKFNIRYSKLPQHIKSEYLQNQYQQHRLFDIYSLGKTLNYIFFNSFDLPPMEQLYNYGPHIILQNLYFLIDMCLQVDPNYRPGYGEVTSFLGSLSTLFDI